MPYTAEGIRADILLNPFSFITRMTPGHFDESTTATALCFVDPTPELDCAPHSSTYSIHAVERILVEHGYTSNGTQGMFSGRTGERFKTPIFVGMIFVQQLCHFSEDKAHARGKGIMNSVTNQPPKGRKNDSGGRTGEMEVMAFKCAGGAFLAYERLITSSDGMSVHICDTCASIVRVQHNKCVQCGRENPALVETSRAFLYMQYLLKSAFIRMDLSTDDRYTLIDP